MEQISRVIYMLPFRSKLTEVQACIIDSCLQRGDTQHAQQLLGDWNIAAKPKAHVTKWNPGTHYYALDTKFDTFQEARKHLERNSYECLGLRERFIYDRFGD